MNMWSWKLSNCCLLLVLQTRDTAPSGWATSLRACRGSTCAEPATLPVPTAAPLTWRLSPVRTHTSVDKGVLSFFFYPNIAASSLNVNTVCVLFPSFQCRRDGRSYTGIGFGTGGHRALPLIHPEEETGHWGRDGQWNQVRVWPLC